MIEKIIKMKDKDVTVKYSETTRDALLQKHNVNIETQLKTMMLTQDFDFSKDIITIKEYS